MEIVLYLSCIVTLLPPILTESWDESRIIQLENQLEKITSELIALKKQCAVYNNTSKGDCSEGLDRGTRAEDPFVAFSATINQDISPISRNEVIVFDHVITNVGGAYDPFIGRFQATVSGYYHFIATIISYSSHFVEVELIQDGRLLCRARASQSYNAMGTCAATVYMDVKSDVWLRHHSSSGDYIRGNYFPSFTGFLVRAN